MNVARWLAACCSTRHKNPRKEKVFTDCLTWEHSVYAIRYQVQRNWSLSCWHSLRHGEVTYRQWPARVLCRPTSCINVSSNMIKPGEIKMLTASTRLPIQSLILTYSVDDRFNQW